MWVVNATHRPLYHRQWSDNHCNSSINNKLLIIINSNKTDNTAHIKLFHFRRTATSVNQIYLKLTMNNIGLRLCHRKPGQEGGKSATHLARSISNLGPKVNWNDCSFPHRLQKRRNTSLMQARATSFKMHWHSILISHLVSLQYRAWAI